MASVTAPRWSASWFFECLERGKTEVFTEQVLLSPSLAKEMLDRNSGNRNVRIIKVQQMAGDMTAGNWRFNGETFIISKDGKLNDGQHRCEAVMRSGIEIPALIVFGVSRESRDTLDQGVARTAGDLLHFDGYANGTHLAAALRLLCAYDRGEGENISQLYLVTNAEVMKKLDGEKDGEIIAFTSTLNSSHRFGISKSILAFAMTVFSRFNRNKAREFMHAVMTGENIARGHPAYTVRNVIMNHTGKLSRQMSVELLFKGYAAYAKGKEFLLFRQTGKLPKLG